MKLWRILAAATVAATLIACSVDSKPTASDSPNPAASGNTVVEPAQSPAAVVKPSPKASTKPPTVAQQNAVEMAEDYLRTAAFSRKGLIDQLKFEGFNTADATYGVDHIQVNWTEQADRMAASYMEHQHFSRSGLISQLKFEGFTSTQAAHGAKSVGL